MEDSKHPVCIRFPPQVREWLRALADIEHRSINRQVVQAMTRWVERHEAFKGWNKPPRRPAGKRVRTPRPRGEKPKHNIAEQVRVLGADSLLPPGYEK